MNPYQSLLEHIYSLILPRGMKLGLGNMREVLACLGNPEKKLKVVHIAGTNGKGSTSNKIAKALQEDGRFGSVGLYTSPHISSFRERIIVDGEMISEDSVVLFLSKILEISETQKIQITFFEVVTVLAFLYFVEKKVGIAVLETGLGGRLDATNVCEPICSVITSISLDHSELLGHTREAIALEKAGIIKGEVPVVIGPHVPLDVVEKVASLLSSPFYQVEGQFANYELENQAIANKCLSILGVHEPKGLEVVPPCRFQQIENSKGLIILDVAHNPDGILHLFQRLHNSFPGKPIIAVFATSKDKDIHSAISLFIPHVKASIFTKASSQRAMDPSLLMKIAQSYGSSSQFFSAFDKVADALEAAEAFQEDGDVIAVFGTFFIMQQVRAYLGIQECVDSQQIIEKTI